MDTSVQCLPERISVHSLPVPDTKFQEAKSDYLGKLIVTPEMVSKKIKTMKDNKSPGVDGIPPQLLIQTVEQISIPLARGFNLLLKGEKSRKQQVVVDWEILNWKSVLSGVPQGSVL